MAMFTISKCLCLKVCSFKGRASERKHSPPRCFFIIDVIDYKKAFMSFRLIQLSSPSVSNISRWKGNENPGRARFKYTTNSNARAPVTPKSIIFIARTLANPPVSKKGRPTSPYLRNHSHTYTFSAIERENIWSC